MRKNSFLGSLATVGILGAGFVLYLIPTLPEAFAGTTTSTFATFTTSTQSIIGYAIPNAAGLSAALIPFLLPIIVCGLLIGLTGALKLEGDMQSFVMKLGLLIGCLLGMLSLTFTPADLVPFAFPFIAAVYFITYLWKKV